MTDLEVYEPPARIGAIGPVTAHELDVYLRQADVLAQSDIIPAAYRRKPANIIVAALTGRSIGWDALTAMRCGHVIEGTFSIKPEAMLALVRRAGHSVAGETGPEQATVTGRRRDTGDEMTVTFTLGDARAAGLAGKSTWKQYPASMCWARAVAQLCRMLFADVTMGLSYTPEELGASVNADGDVVDVEESAAPEVDEQVEMERTVMAELVAALEPEQRGDLSRAWQAARLGRVAVLDRPGLDRAWPLVEAARDAQGEVFDHRRRALFAALADAGVDSGDEARHELIGRATEGATSSSSTLTADQYQQVLAEVRRVRAAAVPT